MIIFTVMKIDFSKLCQNFPSVFVTWIDFIY